MYYYLVAIASSKYHGRDGLTYGHGSKLAPGSVVSVPLQKQTVLGFVLAEVPKPAFAAKPIADTYDLPAIPESLITLHEWLRSYYPAPLGVTAQLFLPKDLPGSKLGITDLPADSDKSTRLPKLTKQQQNALESIDGPGSFLLHGETGSGKTRLYIELARRVLGEGKSAIVLTPEISLTSQLAQEFSAAFPDTIAVLHSHMTNAERRIVWLRLLRATKPHIVIGPRSALFSPLNNLGLIVVDESHEFAYKQENAPHYHAARVASKLAALHNAQLVLGSATPSISDFYIAEQKQRPVIRMSELASQTATAAAEVITIDLRDRSTTSRDPHLSDVLLGHIDAALKRQQQVLLFINRRGTARIVLCDKCGWQAVCPHCDLPLTYHHDTHSLRCHACSHAESARSSCPNCGNSDITLKSVGTKSIVSSVQKFFPTARVARFDTDNKKGERIDESYKDIRAGNVDILVGTQMLVKGLDLPKLSVVGVINADASLYIPDFTAQERTYQLLYQIIGRIGRGHQEHATAILQTYTPDNPILKAASARDWQSFYQAELRERQEYLFPPFCYLMKISVKRAKLATTLSAAEKLIDALHAERLKIAIEGPAPAFHEKVQNKYVWQLIIKSKERSELLKVIDLLPKDWSYDIDPINLL